MLRHTYFSSGCSPYGGARLASKTKLIVKQKDMIQENTTITTNNIKVAILAAIRIANLNLLNMEARMEAKTKRGQVRYILQGEAENIFKGNLVRILKQIIPRDEMNRLKTMYSWILTLHNDWAVIGNIDIKCHDFGYTPEWMKVRKVQLQDAFAQITSDEILEVAIAAMAEFNTTSRETLMSLDEGPNSLSAISFNSLQNIKF